MHATRDQLHRFLDENAARLDNADPSDGGVSQVAAAVVIAAAVLLTVAAAVCVVLSVI